MKYGIGGGGPLGARKYDIVQITRGRVLEIGRGPYKVWPHFIAMRERSDTTMPPGMAADHWCDTFAEGLKDFQPGSLDAIVIHRDCALTMGQIAHLLRVGGHLVQGLPDDKLGVAVKAEDGEMCYAEPPLRLEKTALVVRFGAIGDALQTSALFPTLKEQGYHVTLMCEPRGEMLLANDPHVDRFLVQDKDQVPNQELGHYLSYWSKKFDKFINLCESVEGSLLKLPGRVDHQWPKSLLHELCNRNYGEFMAKIAELPFSPEYHFYETEEERDSAERIIADIATQQNQNWVIGQKWTRPFVIMWVLSGSAVHKVYPHQDSVIAAILKEIPHAHIVTVGDAACVALEAGWENEKRVHRYSGELSIRDTLALAKQCDLVIGPETGVLNGVAYESNAKIVLLSHSSVENLTKHWVNTESIEPQDTPCYPCHKMHYGWHWCTKHEPSSTALCQWNITPDRVWDAVKRAYTSTGIVRQVLERPHEHTEPPHAVRCADG